MKKGWKHGSPVCILCDCKVIAVGKISDCHPGGPRSGRGLNSGWQSFTAVHGQECLAVGLVSWNDIQGTFKKGKSHFSKNNAKLDEKNKFLTRFVQKCLEMHKSKQKPNISEDFHATKSSTSEVEKFEQCRTFYWLNWAETRTLQTDNLMGDI